MDPSGKGKGRVPDRDHVPSDEDASSSSWMGRIATSASGLSRDAIGGTTPGQTLSNAMENDGKGSSSTHVFPSSETLSQSNRTMTPNDASSQFREHQASLPVGLISDFDQWSAHAAGPDTLNQPVEIGFHDGNAAHSRLRNSGDATPSMDQSRTRDDVNASTDGADVVRILSDPTFQPQSWEDVEDVSEEQPFTISEEESFAADRFVQNISGKSRKELSDQLNNSLQLDASRDSTQHTLSFFDDIQNYHQDVWGVLETLVDSARTELRQGQLAERSPAIARLRMILGHIDPSKVM